MAENFLLFSRTYVEKGGARVSSRNSFDKLLLGKIIFDHLDENYQQVASTKKIVQIVSENFSRKISRSLVSIMILSIQNAAKYLSLRPKEKELLLKELSGKTSYALALRFPIECFKKDGIADWLDIDKKRVDKKIKSLKIVTPLQEKKPSIVAPPPPLEFEEISEDVERLLFSVMKLFPDLKKAYREKKKELMECLDEVRALKCENNQFRERLFLLMQTNEVLRKEKKSLVAKIKGLEEKLLNNRQQENWRKTSNITATIN